MDWHFILKFIFVAFLMVILVRFVFGKDENDGY